MYKWRECFMKKILSVFLIFVLVFSITGCGKKETATTDFDKFTSAIDLEFSKGVIESLSAFGDDPDTGNRSAGSPAEHETADYLMGVMEDIGLSNVTKDSATVDGWTYKGANVTYKDEDGKEQKIILGGYATNLVAKNETVPLVYLGEGTATDYDNVDVNGKLVLMDINQDENWWINYPAYQAKLKGAKAVIAMSIMATESEDRIGSQDICGPADAPAYGISQKDSKALQKRITSSENNEIMVQFNSDSTVTKDATSYNVWGEIPGTTDQVVYILGHYDGYYHSSFDNASGIATGLGIAKAIIDSGYTPEKTIRIVSHGSEEFGLSDNTYDWATGAYQQIMTNHPEWAEKAFAAVNIDGAYPVKDEVAFGMDTSHELYNFAKTSAQSVVDAYGYTFVFRAPATTGTEDFVWTQAGIPSISASEGDESLYYNEYYHSNMDSIEEAGLNEKSFKFNHELYGKIILDLDAKMIRPMDFATRFEYLADSVDQELIPDQELQTLMKEAIAGGNELKGKMASVEDSGKAEDVQALNKALFLLYKQIQDDLLRGDFNAEVLFPHEHYQANISYLSEAISALEKGDIPTALDENLSSVDLAWYATAFDEAVCQYFIDQLYNNRVGTWGEKLVQNPICDLDGIVRSLSGKDEMEGADLSSEIAELRQLLVIQQGYLDEAVANEKVALKKAIATMSEL